MWTVAFCTFGGQLPPFYLVRSSVCHSVSLSLLPLSQKFKLYVDVNLSEEPGQMSADIGNISLVSANNYWELAAGLKAAFSLSLSLSLSELTKTMYKMKKIIKIDQLFKQLDRVIERKSERATERERERERRGPKWVGGPLVSQIKASINK